MAKVRKLLEQKTRAFLLTRVIPPQTSQASARGSLEPRDLSPGVSNELSVG